MDEFGFTVVAGTGWGILHKAEAWAQTEKTFRAIAETHAAVGAEYIVHLPPMFRDEKSWEFTDDRVLDPDAWKLYVDNANRLGQILKDEYGLKMVLHPHGDSHIETPEDIDRVFAATDPTYVNLCLDTGHIVYGGGDPIEMVAKYPERISYVHIKAFDVELTREAHEKDWPFGEAVARGLSVRPPAGAPDMKQLVDAIAGLGKELYVICEQDLYPCDPRLPLPNAVMTRQYLASCGLGLALSGVDDTAMRFAIIGAGRIGAVHARSVAAHPEAQLVLVCDPVGDAAATLAAAHGARWTKDVDDGLRGGRRRRGDRRLADPVPRRPDHRRRRGGQGRAGREARRPRSGPRRRVSCGGRRPRRSGHARVQPSLRPGLRRGQGAARWPGRSASWSS